MNAPSKKSLMVELLLARVLGDKSTAFAAMCARQGISLEAAVYTALRDFEVSHTQPVLAGSEAQLLAPNVIKMPDPADCPQGQEEHWLKMCDHDIDVLRREQARFAENKDVVNLRRVTRTIEGYFQARDALRSRLECG